MLINQFSSTSHTLQGSFITDTDYYGDLMDTWPLKPPARVLCRHGEGESHPEMLKN